MQFVLPFINRVPFDDHDGKKERKIKFTFDDFLRPAVEARRAGKPYAKLINNIPEYEMDLISTYHNLPFLHKGLGIFTDGYSLEFDYEVEFEYEKDKDRNKAGDEIIMNLGYPFFPNKGN